MAKGPKLTVGADLWLSLGGHSLAARRFALLAEIARAGSITRAAKNLGLSYKGTWDAIEQMNNLAGEPLLERTVGGLGGGGTRLTERGTELLRSFALIEAEHARFVERLNRRAGDLSRDVSLVESLAMKTSARNQFSGSVHAVRKGAVNDEVELEIIGGQRIVAVITSASRASLGLKRGARAFALVKASSILVMTGGDGKSGGKLSARNQLEGKVSRIKPGAVNAEVILDLPGGGSIAAIITNLSAKALGLVKGAAATAVFKASSVIIGTTA